MQQTALKEFFQRKTQATDGVLFAPTEGLEEIKLADTHRYIPPTNEPKIQVLPYLDSTNKICGS